MIEANGTSMKAFWPRFWGMLALVGFLECLGHYWQLYGSNLNEMKISLLLESLHIGGFFAFVVTLYFIKVDFPPFQDKVIRSERWKDIHIIAKVVTVLAFVLVAINLSSTIYADQPFRNQNIRLTITTAHYAIAASYLLTKKIY